MKILFFTENNHSGGLGSFLVYLIDNRPNPDDQFTVVCNAGHPGLDVVRARLRRPCRIVAHSIPLHWQWIEKIARTPLPDGLVKVLSVLSRYPFFLFCLVSVRRLLLAEEPDRLMVVNGGYPGAEGNGTNRHLAHIIHDHREV